SALPRYSRQLLASSAGPTVERTSFSTMPSSIARPMARSSRVQSFVIGVSPLQSAALVRVFTKKVGIRLVPAQVPRALAAGLVLRLALARGICPAEWAQITLHRRLRW